MQMCPSPVNSANPSAANEPTLKPGITGLAQVEGRDTITLSERTRLNED